LKAILEHTSLKNQSYSIQVTGSKSESNRLLILQALYPNLQIQNLSDSDDTIYLKNALASRQLDIDIHHAGTAMRFLTAYFACQPDREVILTGSQRMQERPIEILVKALNDMGASISYEKRVGFPPLRIKGARLLNNSVSLLANTSSQYISALMLIGATLPKGLNIHLEGTPTSVPYIEMTLSLLKRIGISGNFKEDQIQIPYCPYIEPQTVTVESDWSSASYFYSIVALSEGMEIELSSYRRDSLQGDSALVRIFDELGVKTIFNPEKGSMILSKKENFSLKETISLNLVNTPDIAQTIAVVCFGLGMGCELTGLHTLKIKETDRLIALKQELEKLGAQLSVTSESLHLLPRTELYEGVTIQTYNDHRMAMAFAPLAQKCSLLISDSEVVSKSFPSFWKDLRSLGFLLELQ